MSVPPCCRLLLLALLFSPLPLLAEEAETTPWFDIELIIFQQSDSQADQSMEQWPEDPELPDWQQALNLQAAPDQEDPWQPTAFALLPQQLWQLKADAEAISREQGRVGAMIHTAWRQPVVSREDAQPIYLRSQSEVASGVPVLEGTVKVSVNRYLHLESDLMLKRLRPFDNLGSQDLSFGSPYQGFRFIGKRRMRSSELHYLDHPKMGILILVSRYEIPEPPEPEPEPEPPVAEDPAATSEAAPQAPSVDTQQGTKQQ